jgi:hypothetical protein
MVQGSSSTPSRVPQNVLLIIFIALALSFTALVLALSFYPQNSDVAVGLLLFGFLGVTLSTYVLFQTRRRIMRLRIETSSTTTTIECKKCGFKNVREFQRGDYIFKEVEPCQKCNEKMLITAIYKEVREKGKEGTPS